MSAQWQFDRPNHSPPQDPWHECICLSQCCRVSWGSWLSTKKPHGRDFRGCAISFPHPRGTPCPLYNLPKRRFLLAACISPVTGSSPLPAHSLFSCNLVSSFLGLPITGFNAAFNQRVHRPLPDSLHIFGDIHWIVFCQYLVYIDVTLKIIIKN